MRHDGKPSIRTAMANTDMMKTATWLRRAEALLSKEIGANQSEKEMEDEMMFISRLVSEAPTILSISKELPKLVGALDTIDANNTEKTSFPISHFFQERRASEVNDAVIDNSEHITGKRKSIISPGDNDDIPDSPTNPMKILASLSSQAAPAPIIVAKCTATCPTMSNSASATDDAADFVNFLQSVVHGEK